MICFEKGDDVSPGDILEVADEQNSASFVIYKGEKLSSRYYYNIEKELSNFTINNSAGFLAKQIKFFITEIGEVLDWKGDMIFCRVISGKDTFWIRSHFKSPDGLYGLRNTLRKVK